MLLHEATLRSDTCDRSAQTVCFVQAVDLLMGADPQRCKRDLQSGWISRTFTLLSVALGNRPTGRSLPSLAALHQLPHSGAHVGAHYQPGLLLQPQCKRVVTTPSVQHKRSTAPPCPAQRPTPPAKQRQAPAQCDDSLPCAAPLGTTPCAMPPTHRQLPRLPVRDASPRAASPRPSQTPALLPMGCLGRRACCVRASANAALLTSQRLRHTCVWALFMQCSIQRMRQIKVNWFMCAAETFRPDRILLDCSASEELLEKKFAEVPGRFL